jgi:predicted nucleic acid-binding Zn ribbon protein
MTAQDRPADDGERDEDRPQRASSANSSAAAGADLVRSALARAKADARARAAVTARGTRAAARREKAEAEEQRASGDPVAFGSAVSELLDERGWQADARAARVLADWESIVGAEVAAASRPVRLRGGELQVEAESTAWATQLRLLSRSLLARITAELGPGIVTKLTVRGPTAPDWRHGRLRVPGPGPRDTYG